MLSKQIQETSSTQNEKSADMVLGGNVHHQVFCILLERDMFSSKIIFEKSCDKSQLRLVWGETSTFWALCSASKKMDIRAIAMLWYGKPKLHSDNPSLVGVSVPGNGPTGMSFYVCIRGPSRIHTRGLSLKPETSLKKLDLDVVSLKRLTN